MSYTKGKIYCLKSCQTNKIYIGSTKQILNERFRKHKCDYNRYLNGKCHYMTSFDILQYDDAYIELIEEYPCENKAQLERREGEIIKLNENCINKNIAGRTKQEYGKEYYEKNKDKLCEYKKEYYETNKDKINEKIYCECGGYYTYNHKAKHCKTKKHLNFMEQNLCEIK